MVCHTHILKTTKNKQTNIQTNKQTYKHIHAQLEEDQRKLERLRKQTQIPMQPKVLLNQNCVHHTPTPHHTTPHHATPHHTTPHHTTPRHTTPRHITPPHHATSQYFEETQEGWAFKFPLVTSSNNSFTSAFM